MGCSTYYAQDEDIAWKTASKQGLTDFLNMHTCDIRQGLLNRVNETSRSQVDLPQSIMRRILNTTATSSSSAAPSATVLPNLQQPASEVRKEHVGVTSVTLSQVEKQDRATVDTTDISKTAELAHQFLQS